MARKPLDAVGDAGSIAWCNNGTLSLGGSACGTLTGGTLTGVFGDGFISTGSFNTFSGVYSIDPNEVDVKEVGTTKLGFIADTSQPGTPNYGEVKAELAEDPALTTLVNAWVDNKVVQFFKITVNDADTPSGNPFLGWVKKFTPIAKELKKDETAKANLTLRITGKANYSAGA